MSSVFRPRAHPALLAATAIVLAVLACSPMAPAATPTPSALPGLAGTGAVIQIANNSARAVCFLQISLSTSDEWGEDWLGASGMINSGQTVSFQIAPGTYDMRAEDCDQALIAELWDVRIPATGFTWDIPFVPETVTLVNNSQAEICYVLISPSINPNWGSDWLGSRETVPPGSTRTFAVPPGQEYDLQAKDCDNNVLDEQGNIFISSAGITWTVTGRATGGGAPTVRVVNQTNTAICYLFISPSTASDWGEDWLGSSEVIQPGATRDFSVPPGQQYDLRAEDCNHNMLAEEYNITVTAQGITWTLSPSQ